VFITVYMLPCCDGE